MTRLAPTSSTTASAHLGHDQRVTHALVVQAVGRPAAPLSQHRLHPQVRRPQRGDEPGNDAAEDRDTEEEQQCDGIELDAHPRGKLHAHHSGNHVDTNPRQRQADQRSCEREQKALGQELANQPPPSRAERQAHGQLAVASDGTGAD
jgi:hypothetical protein